MDQFRQKQNTNRNTKTLQSNRHRPTISIQKLRQFKVQGIKALQYIKYQDVKLKEYLRKYKGMKVFMETFNTFKSKKTDEELRHTVRSRRYEITNEDEIPEVLNQMATDVELQMDKMELSESGLVVKQIEKLKFNYDKYNPTRGGKFIALPKWVSTKKAYIHIQR